MYQPAITIRRRAAVRRRPRSPFGGRRVLSSLVALLYLVAGGLASLHTHDAARRAATRSVSTAATASDRATLTAANPAAATDCAVCDLLAHLVSPEPATPALTCAFTATEIPAPPTRPRPYLPYRFCDRSSSRGPPTSPALA